ncbi:hypothetical protein V6N11_051191 [Hibiscus sabdariffa]|uniref:Uncharacterized protein n=2 Tax=Hibiscus sabdariffa TaxID=183260 RepID=A0ABR2A0R6_9ROSI
MREKNLDFSYPHSPHRLPFKSRPPPRCGIYCLHRRDSRIDLSSIAASTHNEGPSFIRKVCLKVCREPRVSPWFILRSRSPHWPCNSRTPISSSLSFHESSPVLHSPRSAVDRPGELGIGSAKLFG